MFVGIAPALDYVDPWLSSFDDRLRQLVAQPRHIAYFYEYPDASTFRYRVFNPGLTLAADPACGVSGSWFCHRDLSADDSFIDVADALVICRARYNSGIARMVARSRARGIPVLFDCDDLVFDNRRVHLLVDTLNLEQSRDGVWDDWFASTGKSAQLWASVTPSSRQIVIWPSASVNMNPDCEVPSSRITLTVPSRNVPQGYHRAKQGSGWARDGQIHIGYFSG